MLASRRSHFDEGGTVATKKRLGFLPGWRIFSYVILLFNVLMLVWIIAGAASSSGAHNCGSLDSSTCAAANNAGTAIGVGILIVLWALGDVILGVLWMVTRPRGRDCPACGERVKRGVMRCGSCGFDFRSMAQPQPQFAPPPPPPPTAR